MILLNLKCIKLYLTTGKSQNNELCFVKYHTNQSYLHYLIYNEFCV